MAGRNVPGSACVTANAETEVTTYSGYWGRTDGLFPVTGDVSYVHAVGAVVGNPCSGGDVVGFDFFLPPGASTAVSATTPVRCIATRLSDGFTTTTDPNIHCAQTAATGTYGGLFFGYAVTPHGWAFEIQVPVHFDRVLGGITAPSTDKVTVVTSSANGPKTVSAYVTVPLHATVNYPSPSATYVTAVSGNPKYTLTSYVYNYFTAGTAYLDAGTVSGSYSNPNIANAPIPDTANAYQIAYDLTVAPGTTVYWRVRFVASSSGATFYGPEQSYVANGSAPASYALTVSKAGAGAGDVTSDPQGLACGTTCTTSFTAGTLVSLTPTPGPGSQFTGWTGACTGTLGCTVSMNAAASVTATFGVLPPVTVGRLDIIPGGLPTGASAHLTVTGPGGFNVTYDILSGRALSLSDVAVGEYDAVVANVVVGADTWVPRPATPSTAVLAGAKGTISTTYAVGRSLSVAKAGAGAGTVSSNPAGIACGATCSGFFADGETVKLVATPAAGAVFAGWSGSCSGLGDCAVVMTAAASATATFNVAPTNALVVTKAGAGSGTVTSSPAGIDCGGVCSFNFDATATVKLSASASAGSTFAGWSGACSGSGTCPLALSSARAVTATFNVAAIPDAGTGSDAGTPDAGAGSSNGGGGCGTGPAAAPAALILLAFLAGARVRRLGRRER